MTDHQDTTTGLTAERLRKLRAVAEAAFPGSWKIQAVQASSECGDWTAYGVETVAPILEYSDSDPAHVALDPLDPEDATYIATFDPPTTLALLDRIAQLERERDEARAKVERLKVVDKLLAESEEANETYQGIEKELDELKTALTELAPSAAIIPTEEVVIDGDIFTWADLPGVLKRTRESVVDAQREAKYQYIKRQEAEAALERVDSLHSIDGDDALGEFCEQCNRKWPCPTIALIRDETAKSMLDFRL